MYRPEKLIDICMEKIYQHNYCEVDRVLNVLKDDIRKRIASHEYYSRYELVETDDDMYTRFELIGKKPYSF